MNAKYVKQIHNAKKAGRHIDFRIDINGSAKSWAIRHWPKYTYEKRLAVEQPDHSVQYMSFQGTIPNGEYGAGTVKIEDSGDLDLISHNKDKYKFNIGNDKYILFRTSGDQWLIEKLN